MKVSLYNVWQWAYNGDGSIFDWRASKLAR